MHDATVTRIAYIDALRGIALFLMVLNHAAMQLLAPSLDPARHYLIYFTMSLSAPLFLLLVGFSLALSFYRTPNNIYKFHISRYWKYAKRGIILIMTGYLLNIIITPHEPFFAGGILQTIGLSIILISPVLSWLQHRIYRDALLLLALLLYLLFIYALTSFASHLEQYPILTTLFLDGFPPWPWLSFVLVGAVLGYQWIEVSHNENSKQQYIMKIKKVAIGCLIIYFTINLSQGYLVNFNLQNDYIVNGHWLPNSTSLFWILGMSLITVVIIQHIFTKQYRYTQWLVALGQSALVLYVVHLIIIASIANQLLEWRIDQWWVYIIFNILLIMALIFLASRVKPLQHRMRKIFTP